MIAHHFTVDVEEYFQVSAFEAIAPPARWGALESRLGHGMDRLLALLADRGVTGTFFVLGWIAARFPELVRRLADGGHEIASHGWDHRRVTHQLPAEFRESVRRSKSLLESITGLPVLGFRAPSFSIVRGREWALDVLIEEGYRYDSSLFPILRPGYGYAGICADPHVIRRPAGTIVELPPATLRRLRVSLPAGGGAYFRLFPYALVQAALTDAERRGAAATFYIHPWELDPEQPRFDVSWPTRIRHYGGLRRTRERLARLLGEFRFTTMRGTAAALAASSC